MGRERRSVSLLFVAAAGKSAQLPLFPWLADAMEGPTPVSALIHAATMVTAGVYLMCRIAPLLAQAHDAQLVVATVGAVTAFVAATIGCAQQDIKKVLAYSTVSQLGYMFLAVGTGAYEAAIFLMVAHAFFKALLFLGAGSVIHGLHDEQDLKRMGNLRRYMKLTFFTFGIGTLAIAGIPPLSGFFAKGDVLDNAFSRYPRAVGHRARHRRAHRLLHDEAGGAGVLRRRPLAPGVGRFGLGPRGECRAARGALGDGTPVGGAGRAGLLRRGAAPAVAHQLGPPRLAGAGVRRRPSTRRTSRRGTLWTLGIVDAVVAFLGLGVAFSLWWSRVERPALEPVVLQRAYYLDDIYDAVIARPGQAFATVLRHGDRGQGDRRGRQRRGSAHACGGRRPAPGPDRIRAAVRAGHRARHGGAVGLDDLEGGVMTHDTAAYPARVFNRPGEPAGRHCPQRP